MYLEWYWIIIIVALSEMVGMFTLGLVTSGARADLDLKIFSLIKESDILKSELEAAIIKRQKYERELFTAIKKNGELQGTIHRQAKAYQIVSRELSKANDTVEYQAAEIAELRDKTIPGKMINEHERLAIYPEFKEKIA